MRPSAAEQRRLERAAWEANNSQDFENDFRQTQAEGARKFGMRFVLAVLESK